MNNQHHRFFEQRCDFYRIGCYCGVVDKAYLCLPSFNEIDYLW